MSRFQRDRDAGEEQRATALELFYDLVFVFALTQISHILIVHLSWQGAGQAAVVLLVVWWAWNYTTWTTNELDPDSAVVKLVLIGIMVASLLMAVAIPKAFGAHGLIFAISYFTIQVGRHLFLTFGSAAKGTLERARAGRILIWLTAAGVLWVAGGLAEGNTRTVLWICALVVDYSGPIFFYWVPHQPRLASSTWNVETSHFAERFQLFMIIALGESIAITGATASHLELTTGRVAAFTLAFLVTAAMWWLYFHYVAAISQRRLSLADEDRTRLARDGFTYLHVVMVAGIILWAVGDSIVIAHPTMELSKQETVAVISGPAIYLIGHVLFRLRMAGTVSWKRTGGALCCVLIGVAGLVLSASALLVAGLLFAVLAFVNILEYITGVRSRGRGEPSPIERLDALGDST